MADGRIADNCAQKRDVSDGCASGTESGRSFDKMGAGSHNDLARGPLLIVREQGGLNDHFDQASFRLDDDDDE